MTFINILKLYKTYILFTQMPIIAYTILLCSDQESYLLIQL